jgi:FAD:protein FMN transferase
VKNLIENLASKKEFPLFGKNISITLYDIEETLAEVVFDDIYKEALRLQKIFNFYDKDSELSGLNKIKKMKVSDDMLYVLKSAIKYARQTNGLYDITKGKEFLQRKNSTPIKKVLCSYKDISLNETDNLVELLHPDVLIDLGSIAKGYITDKLAEYIKELGIESALIDSRGDLKIFGNTLEMIWVQHPRKENGKLKPFFLENMSAATSGDYNQFFGDYENSHILNKKDFCSVTVVAENLMDADAAATCISVLGKEGVMEFLKENPTLKVFAIGTDLKEYDYNSFEELEVKNYR